MNRQILKAIDILKNRENLKLASEEDYSQEYSSSIEKIINLYIKDSAPHLLGRKIGFKLINKSADGYKAAADVLINLGNKVGHVIYIYDSGDLKVKNVLMLPDKDLYVPATPKWIERLSSSDDEFAKLIQSNEVHALSPDISPFKYSPNKRASLDEDSGNSFKNLLKTFVENDERCACLFVDLINKKADFVKFAVNRYGKDTIKKAIQNTKNYISRLHNHFKDEFSLEKKASLPEKIKFYKYQINGVYDDLDHEEKSKLLIRGYYIKDDRSKEEINLAKEVNIEKIAKRFGEPLWSGIYKIGDKYLLFLNNGSGMSEFVCDCTEPGPIRRKNLKVGVLSSSQTFNSAKNEVDISYDSFFVPDQDQEEAKNRLEKFLKNLKNFNKFVEEKRGRKKENSSLNESVAIAINPTTKEFIIFSYYNNKDSNTFLCGCLLYPHHKDVNVTLIPSSVTKLTVSKGHTDKLNTIKIAVPADWKVIELGSAAVSTNNITNNYKYLIDVRRLDEMVKESGFKIKNFDDTYFLNDKRYFNKSDVIKELVFNYNLSTSQAEHIVNTSSSKDKKYIVFNNQRQLVKKAQIPPTMPFAGPSANPMGQNVNMGVDYSGMGVGGGMGMSAGFPGQAMDPNMMTKMMSPQMQNTGLTDAYMVSSMLEHGGPELIRKYLKDVLKGNSNLAKIAMNLAWHKDELVEYYGEEEYGTLLDNINKLFNSIGEIYLKLQEKKVNLEHTLV